MKRRSDLQTETVPGSRIAMIPASRDPARLNLSQESDDTMPSTSRTTAGTAELYRTTVKPPHGIEDPGVAAEKARSDIASTQMWVCPGPEWPPEEETCGRMLQHTGRCKECAVKRMRLRKAERREKKRLDQKTNGLSTEFAFPIP